MRKHSVILPSAAIGAALTLLVTGPQAIGTGSSARSATSDTYRQLSLFGDAFERVRNHYVDKPDDRKLVESAISAMLAGLDPHSSYLDARSYREMRQRTHGEYGGLGFEITMEDGLLRVVRLIEDTPASRAGITAGDIITRLDDKAVQALSYDQAVDRMRGPTDSKIKLTIVRKGQERPIEVILVRDRIRLRSVRAHQEGDDIGYIRIGSFDEQTTAGVTREIGDLTAQIGADRIKGFIIDLRNNPGGLLEEAVTVTEAFLARGEIVSTRGRSADENQRRSAHGGDLTNGKPLIVLVNGGSASASEIVAGALQDHKRATLVGTRSYGKGSVQTIIPLGDGGALTLTTARYFTPSGRSIQAKGVVPDIEVLQDVPDTWKDRAETSGEASLPGHLKSEGDERHGSQSYVPPDARDDRALQAAADLLHGLKVRTPGETAAMEKPAIKVR